MYKQERTERERATRRTGQAEKGQDGGAASSTAGPPEPKRGPVVNGRRHVDSIVEDEEERPGPQSQADPNGQEETRDETMLDDDPNAGDTAGPEGDMDMAEGVTDDVIVGRFWGITPS